MAKLKAQTKKYQMTSEDLDSMRFCNNLDIGLSIKPKYNASTNYYLVKYKISEPNKEVFKRKDISFPDSIYNRFEDKEFEATKEMFNMYNLIKENFKTK